MAFSSRFSNVQIRYGRTYYICVMEGHVTFALRKDMLHVGNRRTGYIWVTEGHVIFWSQKDMLHLYDSYYSKLPAGPRFSGSVSDLKF